MKNGNYELVVAPEGYPGTKYRGRYMYEHHLVWWRRTGETVPKGFVVHHKNEKKRDNRFYNLELKKVAAHTRDHARPKARVTLECHWCGFTFEKSRRMIKQNDKRSLKNNRPIRHFCTRSHAAKQQHLDMYS